MAVDRHNRGSVVLWVVVVISVVYLVLWVSGVRFPRPQPKALIANEEVEVDQDLEGEEVSASDESFDVELPDEPEFVDDGRDYKVPLL